MDDRRTRVLVVTYDKVGLQMAGPAIRAFELSRVLSREHDVVLACRHRPERDGDGDGFDVRWYRDAEGLDALVDWCDVVVAFGFLLVECPSIVERGKIVVADLYDPFILEVLVQKADSPPDVRDQEYWGALVALSEQLRKADFFLVASERQRDLVLGMLAAVNRVNPQNYAADPTLDGLLAVVPFGLPDSDPVPREPVLRGVMPGFDDDDLILLWAGGIYQWFDPESLIEGIARLGAPNVKLLFLGTRHPNPEVPEMPVLKAAVECAERLGLKDRQVFFNDGWVPYDERIGFLLEADVGVSTHHRHVETAYAFRTRMLDYIWSGLPILCTEGDMFADVVRARDGGEVVPAEDPDAIAAAIEQLLKAERRRDCSRNIAGLATEMRWQRVAEPLNAFCRAPSHAADRADGQMSPTPEERHLTDVYESRLTEKEELLQALHAELFGVRQERERLLREIDSLSAFRERVLAFPPFRVMRRMLGV